MSVSDEENSAPVEMGIGLRAQGLDIRLSGSRNLRLGGISLETWWENIKVR